MHGEIKMTSSLGMVSNTLPALSGSSIDNPQDVMAEVKKIILLIFKKFEFNQFEQVFSDILKLFKGDYPGYRQCNTSYHDLSHTMDCLLVTAKLIHGAFLNGVIFEPKGRQPRINLGPHA